MYHGSNPDYHRPPGPSPRYGPPPAPGPRSPFPGPFNRPNYPPHFQSPVSFPGSVPPPGFQSFSSEPVYQTAPRAQFPAKWSLHQDELQNLEVKKKAEEFLRILEAKDRPRPPSESGDKDMKRSRVDDKAERRSSEKHPRGRSRSKSRSRSRGRSRAKSRGRSQGRSRARGRSRSRSGSRGKSRTRAKSRPRTRSRSRSHGRSLARSKSQPRFVKDSQYSIKDAAASPCVSGTVPDLFQNLKQVFQNKELEKHLTVVKNTFMLNQTLEDRRPKQEIPPTLLENLPHVPTRPAEPKRPADLNMTSVLPHERVGGSDSALPRILSWNDPRQNLEALKNKSIFSSIEDEEEFLYGDEEGRKKPQAVTVPLAQNRLGEKNQISPLCISNPLNLQESKGPTVTSRQPLSPDISAEECERVKNLLKTIGLNLGPADISKVATRLKQKQEEQRGASSSVALRATLETLLTRLQKSDDARSNRSESSHSHRDGEHRDKIDEREKEQREKQIQKKRKEYLVKELEGLLKQEGSGDLIPVIGFFCQRCEEFFGDLSSAEGHKHADAPQANTGKPENAAEQIKHEEKQREHKLTGSRDKDERNAERKRPRDDASSGMTGKKLGGKEDNAESSKSTKKKKKKDKKRKKEKYKERGRDKAEKK